MGSDSMDADVDIDVLDTPGHHAGADLWIFIVRGFIVIFTLFGWAGIAFARANISGLIIIIIAFLMHLMPRYRSPGYLNFCIVLAKVLQRIFQMQLDKGEPHISQSLPVENQLVKYK